MLEFRNIDVSVSRLQILQKISVAFEKGKITSIIGPNGCGKTTLLQTLNGMCRVTSGEIVIDGESYFEIPLKERAKRLSFMAQFRGIAPSISVKGLVEHGRFPYMGFSRKMSEEDKAAVNSAMEYVGITEYKDRLVSELSGGIQQKAYLAMQLAQNCQYMVMDEPMNHLDFSGQREMYRLIEKLGDEGKTIIMVSHDLNRALKISDNLVVMCNRKIVTSGTTEDVLKTDLVNKVFDCKYKMIEIDGNKQYFFE